MSIRQSSPEIESAARSMRSSLTKAERKLWGHLKSERLDGARFRAQHALGQVIVDFVCCRARLVIEIDGPYHEDEMQARRDHARDELLAQAGYRVLRFSNDAVNNDLSAVISSIRDALHLASPSLGGGAKRHQEQTREGA